MKTICFTVVAVIFAVWANDTDRTQEDYTQHNNAASQSTVSMVASAFIGALITLFIVIVALCCWKLGVAARIWNTISSCCNLQSNSDQNPPNQAQHSGLMTRIWNRICCCCMIQSNSAHNPPQNAANQPQNPEGLLTRIWNRICCCCKIQSNLYQNPPQNPENPPDEPNQPLDGLDLANRMWNLICCCCKKQINPVPNPNQPNPPENQSGQTTKPDDLQNPRPGTSKQSASPRKEDKQPLVKPDSDDLQEVVEHPPQEGLELGHLVPPTPSHGRQSPVKRGLHTIQEEKESSLSSPSLSTGTQISEPNSSDKFETRDFSKSAYV